ncbi:amino acid permease [Klebsiella quasipneumoniae subsp. similipneumoniae]|nr:amino acid permease [Klebsiella quasipneumoniae subsp. similipneumoniae]
MMSLGGTIGTGLFIGIAEPLHTVGPLGTLLAYLLAGAIMMMTMLCLGELSCAFPHSGSFQHYALMLFPSPIWSYSIGWLYWLSWVFSLAADLTAAGLIAHQCFPQLPVHYVCLSILFTLSAINLTSAGLFGECEYWLSAIKVFAIILFILVGFVLVYQLATHSVWHPTLKTSQGWFPHGPWSIFTCMTIVVYSFQGVELVGNAAGETPCPQGTLSSVISGIGVRIILFYVLAIMLLALIYPWSSPVTGHSPFTWVFERAGLPTAGTFMTLVIFSAALSAANSAIYASSRTLWSMANDGMAPQMLRKVNRKGVPVRCILLTVVFALVSMLTRYVPAQSLYLYLIASTGQVGCLAWMVICWCQYRFRKAVNAGDYPLETLKYRSPWFPWIAVCSFVMNGAVIVGTWFSPGGGSMLFAESVLLCLILLSYQRFHHHICKMVHS